MNTTTATDDIDWHSVAEHARSNVDEIRPLTQGEVVDAIEDVHGHAPLCIVKDAVSAGVLVDKGDDDEEIKEVSFRLPDDDDNEDNDDDGDLHVTDDGRQYAPSMVERDRWVLRTMPGKDIRAPWTRGSLKRVSWGFDLDAEDRPETDFEEALSWAESSATMTLDTHEGEDVEYVAPSYILSEYAEDPETNITMVDLDDVRDPETGYILPEAQEIIDRLNSYTEVSTSGEGVHVFVYGTLPEWYSGNEFTPDLTTDERVNEETPALEIYHRRCHCVTTGHHLEGTPEDVQVAHDTIGDLVEEYGEDVTVDDLVESMTPTEPDTQSRPSSSSRPQSAYYSASVSGYSPLSGFARVGGQLQGPHPVHGSSGGSSYADGGQNCTVKNDSVWYCHSKGHNSSGGALAMCAVDRGYISCEESDPELSALSDTEFAKVCLEFRDAGGVSADETPPYRALLGLAKAQNLADEGDEMFDAALRDVIEDMWDGADASML